MKRLLTLVVAGLTVVAVGQVYAETTVLEPIVVTATRTSRPISQVAATVTVITADQIAGTGATRLDEVLRDTTGIQIVSNGPDGSLATVSIRGSESEQVLILLDGVRLNSAQNGQFNLSDLPVALEDIERIEVLRGPAAALYGSNAFGGVIQIFTRMPQSDVMTRLSWREGQFNTRNLSASIAQKLASVRYRLGARLDRSDGYRENSDLFQYGFDGLLGFDLGSDFKLDILASHLEKEIGVPGATTWLTPNARQEDQNTQSSLTLSGPAGAVDLQARGIYTRNNNKYEDPDAFSPTDDTHLLQTLGAELQASTENGPHTVLIGGDAYRDDLDSTANGKQDQNRVAVFGQYEINPTAWLTMLAGLRYDAHSDFKNETSPKAAVLFALSDASRVRLSAAKAFRAPTLNDRYWPDTGFVRGNPDLVPETAWEFELAYDRRVDSATDLSLAMFLRDADNLIEWAPDGGGVWMPTNISQARIWGFEAGTNLSPHRLLTTGANYTYLYPKDLETDGYLFGKPRHQAHLYFDIGPVNDARFRIDGRYMHYYPEATRTDIKHFVMDASLSRPFIIGTGLEFEAEVTLKNVFDEEYEESPGYPMPPRQLFVGLTATF